MAIMQAIKSTDHQYMASAEYLLGEALVATRRNAQAEAVLRQNIQRWQQNKAPAWRVARSENLLALVLIQMNKMTDGKALLQSSYHALTAKDSGASDEAIAAAKARMTQAGLL